MFSETEVLKNSVDDCDGCLVGIYVISRTCLISRCPMPVCETAAVCGQLEKHPTEKRELQELGKKKQKAEGELKALKSELLAKEVVSNDMSKSFEARIHDTLVRTNPNKYLTSNNKPKEGIILADSYILKKYYGGKIPDFDDIQHESEIWQTIIKSREESYQVGAKVPKNSVIKELENRGVDWPCSNVSRPDIMQAANYNQMNWYASPPFTAPYMYGFSGYYQSPGSTGLATRAIASPPPPPPDEIVHQDDDLENDQTTA